MELIFVRHGQGEHNLDVPGRLERKHPNLTPEGRRQVLALSGKLAATERDLFVTGPTVRTIETLLVLAQGLKQAQVCMSPLAGPRMFPQDPAWSTLPCDLPLTKREVAAAYPLLSLRSEDDEASWNDGINTLPEQRFVRRGTEFLQWIRQQGAERVIFVSHDGTINAYRQLLGERNLSRDDFLGEAGTYTMLLSL
ncbi:histidine phosphatase family protein [Saccharibacillus sacchari]|uniref:Histidine phosphatase family protein n=1 Tax=Saccharibacillus sacchari TaxID=456493 RepID=A0ACC6PAK8_9BACL